MNDRFRKRFCSTLAVLTLTLATVTAVNPAQADAGDGLVGGQWSAQVGEDDAKVSIISRNLDKPTDLTSAIQLATKSVPNVVGYRIANPGIEGEYFPTETNTPEAYTKQFFSDFGTYPQIKGLLVPTQVDKSGVTKALAEEPIPTGLPAYTAKSSGQGKL